MVSIISLVCTNCHKLVQRITRASSTDHQRDARKFCSKQCAGQFKTLMHQELSSLKRIAGAWRKPFKTLRLRQRLLDRRARIQVKSSSLCAVCSKSVGYTCGRPRICCSARCTRVHTKSQADYKEKTKAYKKKRKALERGAKTGTPFKYKDIFARDGWKCQMCGVDTPERLRGTYKHNAPELDHIIPLSKGGTHSIDNAQTLCRSCNAWKSDKIVPHQGGLFTSLLPSG